MIKAIISDFSRVILFPKDESYVGGLNNMHTEKSQQSDYNFWDHYKLNDNLLNLYRSLKDRLKIYIFTTGKIQEYSAVRDKLEGIFDGVFSVEDLQMKKTDPKSYVEVIKRISYKPEEVVFVDDTEQNIEAANKAGMITYLYKDTETLRNLIIKYLSI